MGTESGQARGAPTLAIVVPCFNEEAVLPETCRRLREQVRKMADAGIVSADSFVCFVDDGSTDATWDFIRDAAHADRAVRGLRLSRNFGHQSALLAGMLRLGDRCDCLISIDADLQQDESAMPRFIDAYIRGHDIVFGIRRDRTSDGFLKRVTATAFYRLMGWMGVRIVAQHADYRLMSRRAVSVLATYPEGNLFLRGIVAQLGFRTATVEFDVGERAAGTSKYSFRRMLSFALSGITAFSVVPLRVIAVLGALFTVVAMVMATYVVGAKIFVGSTVPGWASTVLPIYILGGIQLLAIGVIGEYIGRIYLETKRRPRYIVDDDLTG